MKKLAVLSAAAVLSACTGYDQPALNQPSCDAAAAQYRELAERPIPDIPALPIRGAEERRAFRAAREERSELFAARGAALHDYAEACQVGAAALEEGR